MEISCNIGKEQVFLSFHWYLQVVLLLTIQCVFFLLYLFSTLTTILGLESETIMSSSYMDLFLHYVYLGEGMIPLKVLHAILTFFIFIHSD